MGSDQNNSSSNSSPSLLAAPLRLVTGWGRYPKKLGFVSVLVLVFLRLVVGWHFYTEGTSKMQSDFDSSRFLLAAKGPFAEHFHSMVWDHDGQMRLDREATEKRWQHYRATVASHYGFDAEQQKRADQVLARTLKQYVFVLDSNAGDIEEISYGRGRLVDLDGRAERRDVASLRGQKGND